MVNFSKEFFESLFHDLTVGLMIMENHKIVYANKHILEILKLNSNESIIGHSILDFAPEFQPCGEETPKFVEQNCRLVNDQSFSQFPFSIKNKLNQVIDLEISTKYFSFENRLYQVCVWEDLTEIKTHENELKKSNDLLFTYFEALDQSSGVTTADLFGNITFSNKNFQRISGYSQAELIGKNYRLFNSGAHPKEFFENMWKTILSGEVWKGEIQNRNKLGEFLWLDTTIVPVKNLKGEVEKFITIRHDISKLKEQQEENWKQLQFQASVNRSTSNLIMRLDLDGTITYFNRVSEKTLGYDSDEIINLETPLKFIDPTELQKKTEELNRLYQEDLPPSLIVLTYKATKNLKNEEEWIFKKKSGENQTILFSMSLLVDQDQFPIGYMMVGTDITKQKKIENDLIRAKNEAELTLKLKNEYMSRLSHEIKTPLNGILGMAELIIETSITSEQKDYLDSITQSSQRLLSLVNKTLEYGQVESGNLELIIKEFDLKEVLLEISKNYHEICHKKKIDFLLNDKLTHPVFEGDKRRIEQIIHYLLENAVKYTKSGKVSLSVTELFDTGEVKIEVRDTGIGIEKERITSIFNAFSYENRIETDFSGIGISLAITERIVKALNGSIQVKSNVGVGTLFTVLIPMIHSETNHLKLYSKVLDKKLAKALIVEDDPINQRLLKKLLNKFEIYPEVVGNGLEALETQSKNHFDIIFMDINMPVMDGFEATSIMRAKKDKYKEPIIVAVTANSVIGDQEECFKQGMDEYISKPIKKEELEKLLDKIFNSANNYKNDVIPLLKNRNLYLTYVEKDFVGDEEILIEYVQDFINELEPTFKKIKQGILEDQFEIVEYHSRRVKELVTTFHHEELKRMLESLENYGKDKKKRNILPFYSDIENSISNFAIELKEYFNLK